MQTVQRCGWHIAIDVAWSACFCMSVCLCAGYNREPYENRWIDWDAVWVVDLGVPKEPRIRWVAGHPDTTGKGAILPPPPKWCGLSSQILTFFEHSFLLFLVCNTIRSQDSSLCSANISAIFSSLTTVHRIDNKLSLWWQYTGVVCYEIKISAICRLQSYHLLYSAKQLTQISIWRWLYAFTGTDLWQPLTSTVMPQHDQTGSID